MKIDKSYYREEDVVGLAESLLGKILVTKIGSKISSGIITETEAYNGINDKASHSYGGRRTSRTEIMYAEGGKSYVYLCYGIHYLFNIVTGKKDIPQAILIRSIQPVSGISTILERRNSKKITYQLCNGPGKVTSALGINFSHNALDLTGNKVWLEDDGIKIKKSEIFCGPRIGVDYAGEDAKLPYRFWTDRSRDEY